ncbi:MAG: hypothetical protein RIQ33_2505 [Bacteroidota bacterium]
MDFIFKIKAYLQYRLKAVDEHGIHSPFVFDLLTKVIKSEKHFYAFDEIKHVKKQLANSAESITQVEFGAGSHKLNSTEKKISALAKTVSIPTSQGELLFKLVEYFQPKSILELGTCIGISTLYLSLENKNRPVYTIEANPDSAKLAQKLFKQLECNQINSFIGTFEEKLDEVLQQMKQIDFAFIDGNHRYEPTINYYKKILPYIHENSILIFHDIHWSEGIQQAWEEIKNDDAVSISVDVFSMGFIFFRKGILKQHFVVR